MQKRSIVFITCYSQSIYVIRCFLFMLFRVKSGQLKSPDFLFLFSPLIFARFISAPLIFAQLNNSYIRPQIIFVHWQNLNFRIGLSYDLKMFMKMKLWKYFLALLISLFKTESRFPLMFLSGTLEFSEEI